MAINISPKRLQINKANSTMLAVVSVAAFLTVFSLFASKALLSKRAYQSRVITAKQTAEKQLNDDVNASNQLVSSYQTFEHQNPNLIGGDASTRQGDKNGDNASIVLDALPSEYDFPALTSSLEHIITSNKSYTIKSISGTDQSLSQGAAATSTTTTSQPVAMPFQLSVGATYDNIPALIAIFENSIRPFQFQSLAFSGSNSDLQFNMSAQTYYQPAKNLNTTTEVIK